MITMEDGGEYEKRGSWGLLVSVNRSRCKQIKVNFQYFSAKDLDCKEFKTCFLNYLNFLVLFVLRSHLGLSLDSRPACRFPE